MSTIAEAKELTPVAPRPLLLCRIVAMDGDTVYLGTAAKTAATSITYAGNAYVCKVKEQAVAAIMAMSEQGYDIPGSFALTLGDGDLTLWNDHAQAHGWKGATLTVYLVMWNALTDTFSTNKYIWEFIVEYAEIVADGLLRVPAVAKNAMSRIKVPNVGKGRRCQWAFPSTAAQRLEGLINPTSPYYQCGYSPDVATVGVGNLITGAPATSCNFTREACTARGMFDTDSGAHVTRRFGGNTWVPDETFQGRQYTTGKFVFGFNTPLKDGTYYPIVYGTQWVDAVNLAPAQEPNSIRSEAIVCMALHGPVTVVKVVIGGHEVTQNNPDDPLFTWDYVTQGGRQGGICQDAIFDGDGDPHGSTCKIEWVVPPELAQGGNPSVRVLVKGGPIIRAYAIASASASGGEITLTQTSANVEIGFGSTVNVIGNSLAADGAYQLSAATGGTPGTVTLAGTSASGTGSGGAIFAYPSTGYGYHGNPVWQLMDLLMLGPWEMPDFDVASWVEAAAYCDEPISFLNFKGASDTHARFRSSFALEDSTRQALAQAVLGLRMNAGIILSRSPETGKLACSIERTLAEQQPAPVEGSNDSDPVPSMLANGAAADGYLAYRFDAGCIKPGSLKVGGRAINDCPVRINVKFQDLEREYQTDSISIVEPDAFEASGKQDVASSLPILGIETFDQAFRRGNVEHAKAHYGNTRADAGGTLLIEFTTNARAAHLAGKVGAICDIDYAQLEL